jgi:glycine C-acetyltransferase
MSDQKFNPLLESELSRLDAAHVTKRREIIIDGFSGSKALINHQKYLIFNSNDYLGLRLHSVLKKADHQATRKYGTGPGAVRFISGSLRVHHDLETALAKFHGRQAAMVISSAFAANLAVLTSLVRGSGTETLISSPVLVMSDELNHRSIVDGLRLAQVPSDRKAIYRHLDYAHLDSLLSDYVGKFPRVIIVTDGVFSMLGQVADLAFIRAIINKYESRYPEGIVLVVDDCHGIAAFGPTGRGTEEVSGARADILVGTLGKGLGSDGGYIVGSQLIIDYLRETASTYIYSNSISPGSAASALAAIQLIESKSGTALLVKSAANIKLFKALMLKAGFVFAADSVHPIQPILIGDTAKTQTLSARLYDLGFLVTPISYPVVPRGRDELRVQISSAHTSTDIKKFVRALISLNN